MRLPFAPRLSAAGVCTLAVAAAGLVSTPAITAGLHAIELRHAASDDIAAPAAVAATGLALWAARNPNVESAAVRWLVGGVVAGIAGAIGTCLAISLRLRTPFGTIDDLVLGALIGIAFGIGCLFPGLELAAALRENAHSARDVQIVNTSSWLCTIAAASAIVVPAKPWSTLSIAVALCALASAGLAWLRWRLRRRWLRRILEGSDPAWTTDAGSDRDRALPALELLCAWADERTLVQLEASVGPAYRSAERRIRAGRLVPG